MGVDCNNPKNDQERSLCACLAATEANKRASNAYTAQLAIYNAKFSAHERESKRFQEWQGMYGEFQNWADRKKQLQDERKIWNTCIVWSGVYGHDDWCRNDTGFARQTGAGQHGCALGWGRGECQRDNDQVNKQLIDEGYNRARPVVPPKPDMPNFELVSNIQCCSQIFSDIKVEGGNLKMAEISQDCQQRIINEINKPTPTPPPTTPPTTAAPTGPLSSSVATSSLTENTPMFVIIGIISLISISSILVLFMMNFGELPKYTE